MIDPKFIPALAAIAGALVIDLRSYRSAIEAYRTKPEGVRPKFDVLLCVSRVLDGALTGLAAGVLGTQI